MAKAILEYDLNEENNEFQMVTRASDAFCLLYDIDQGLRSLEKYGSSDELDIKLCGYDDEHIENPERKLYDLIDKLRTYIWDSKLLDLMQ